MCLTPFAITVKRTNEKVSVPCGRCPQCLARRISGWSFRLQHASKQCTSAYFITLTYAPPHCPVTPKGFMSLSKRDVQLFFKRLRKAHPKQSNIRYFACGEYGGNGERPHYHLILFNAERPLIQPAWNLGSVHYGTVSGASIGYTLKYMCKPHRYPKFHGDDRPREFSLMSKNWVRPTLRLPLLSGIKQTL